MNGVEGGAARDEHADERNTNRHSRESGNPDSPEKVYPATAVRYGRMNHIGEFSYPVNLKFACGAPLVISTDRGIEIGSQVPLTCPQCEQTVRREQIRAYVTNSGGDVYRFKNGRILRQATPTDLLELRHIEEHAAEKLGICRTFAAELNLNMKIVDCEHVFGGERIVFYFMAEDRIDFRDLVRRLAGEFQTRIEMRQVGARDEARLLADFETCGRECCCKNFLKTLKPINMHMAKLQKATLDPSKVSGRCGRLKCCLRYEHDAYEMLARRLPRVGSCVATKEGAGRVVDRQILTQLVRIVGDDGRLTTVAVEDITGRDLAPPSSQGEPAEVLNNNANPPADVNGGFPQDSPAGDFEPLAEGEPEGDSDPGPDHNNAAGPTSDTSEPAGPDSPRSDPPPRRRRGGRRGAGRDQPPKPGPSTPGNTP